MSDALTAIDDWIAKLRQVKGLAKKAAPAVAEALTASVNEDLAAGVDPATGAAWEPTKDGRRPLKNAATDAIQGSAVGTTVVLKIKERRYFYHNAGLGSPQRSVLPRGELRPKHAKAVTNALEKEWERIMGK